MKKFDTLVLDPDLTRQQILELRDLLTTKKVLKERQDILPFFRQRPYLAALSGTVQSTLLNPDRLAWEYDLFGDFACDLAVGEWPTKRYCFIEFEDADANSIFVSQGKKATREWAARLDHACSQVIDWFYKLNDRRNSDEYEQRFGKRSIDFFGMVIIGRSADMDAGEMLRWEWWRDHVIIASRRVICLTYDELLAGLFARLEALLPTPLRATPTSGA